MEDDDESYVCSECGQELNDSEVDYNEAVEDGSEGWFCACCLTG